MFYLIQKKECVYVGETMNWGSDYNPKSIQYIVYI